MVYAAQHRCVIKTYVTGKSIMFNFTYRSWTFVHLLSINIKSFLIRRRHEFESPNHEIIKLLAGEYTIYIDACKIFQKLNWWVFHYYSIALLWLLSHINITFWVSDLIFDVLRLFLTMFNVLRQKWSWFYSNKTHNMQYNIKTAGIQKHSSFNCTLYTCKTTRNIIRNLLMYWIVC